MILALSKKKTLLWVQPTTSNIGVMKKKKPTV